MNHNFHYRMIKARVAETIIKELFLVSGYNVFDYGMERSLRSLARICHEVMPSAQSVPMINMPLAVPDIFRDAIRANEYLYIK